MLQNTRLAKEVRSRSLILLATGAIAGLALAGYGLFTAPGSTTNKIPEGAIALVNHRQILLSDFRNQLEALYGVPLQKASAEERKAVLDSMIAEELLVQRGLEIDLPATDPSVREALVAGVELTSTADIAAKQPTEDELKAYFAAHRSQYTSSGTMLVHDLVAPIGPKQSAGQASKTANDAAQALRKGMRIAQVTARFGLKETAPPGASEEMDLVVSRKLGDKLFAVAEKLSAGQVSDPVEAADGEHLLVMEKRRPAAPLEFQAVRDRIAADIKREEQTRAHDEYVQFLRGKAEVLLAPGYSQ